MKLDLNVLGKGDDAFRYRLIIISHSDSTYPGVIGKVNKIVITCVKLIVKHCRYTLQRDTSTQVKCQYTQQQLPLSTVLMNTCTYRQGYRWPINVHLCRWFQCPFSRCNTCNTSPSTYIGRMSQRLTVMIKKENVRPTTIGYNTSMKQLRNIHDIYNTLTSTGTGFWRSNGMIPWVSSSSPTRTSSDSVELLPSPST